MGRFGVKLLVGVILLAVFVVVYLIWRRVERFPGHYSGTGPERDSQDDDRDRDGDV